MLKSLQIPVSVTKTKQNRKQMNTLNVWPLNYMEMGVNSARPNWWGRNSDLHTRYYQVLAKNNHILVQYIDRSIGAEMRR